MSHRPVRRLSVAAVTVLALGSFAACGNDDAESASSETTSSASPAAAESETPIEASELVDVIKGAFDDATTASFEITSQGALPIAADGVIDFTTETPSTDATFSAFGGDEQQIVVVDGVTYIGTGKGRFVELDPAALAGGKGGKAGKGGDSSPSPFGAMGGGLDPEALLGALDSDAVEAMDLGTEDVDGESMDHYQVSVDPKELVASLGGLEGGADGGEGDAQSPLDGMTSMLPEEITVDFLLDEDGLLHSADLGLGAAAGHIIATFDDWGEPVDISAPPASKVDDSSKLSGLGGLGGLGALGGSGTLAG